MNDDYRIALRPYSANGGIANGVTHEPLDDVVVRDVTMFRLEDMGDHILMCCYMDDLGKGERISFSIRRGKRKKGEPPIVVVAYEFPDVRYEGES